MIRKLLVLFLTACTYPLSIHAQNLPSEIPCGTSVSDLNTLYTNMMALRSRYGHVLETRGAVAYIPVCLHLVARVDGTGRVNEAKVLDMMDQWNKTYSSNGLELQFYIKYINNIDNSDLYNAPLSSNGTATAKTNKKTDALNIFICGSAGGSSSSTTLAYYQNRYFEGDALYSVDWVVVRNDEASRETSSTIEHEVGHFFSLPHTFNGFECESFSPTSSNPCAPPSINCNGRFVEVEKSARTGVSANCSTAGDGFCDTPPDYNFGFTRGIDWNNPTNPCSYNGIAKDPTCIAVNPDETNLMGYFTKCSNKFSPLQVSAMRSDYLNNTYRKYLRDGNIAQSSTAIGLANIIVPFNNATTQSYSNIVFDWSDVQGAYGYVFEISPYLSFAAEVKRFVVYSSTLTLNSRNVSSGYLVANKAYFWRVRAFGRYVTGTSFTTATKFTTGRLNAIDEIAGIENLKISPNPATSSKMLELRLDSEKAFEANIQWINVAGQRIKTVKTHFNAGLNALLLDTEGLQKGLYILMIQSDEGILSQKIVIGE